MARHEYEVRDVLRLLNVKAHVLRYWEQSLPIIRPRRDHSGRRVWSAAQLRLLLRIRHLVVVRGMSVAAAGEAVLHEAAPGTADTKARLEALRARLLVLLLRSRAGVGAGDDREDTDRTSAGRQRAGSSTGGMPVGQAVAGLVAGADTSGGGTHGVPGPDGRETEAELRLDALVPEAARRPMRSDDVPTEPLPLRIHESGHTADDPSGPAGEPSVIPVAVSHLWSEGPALQRAELLRDLIAAHGDGRTWVVPVPPDAREAFSRVFGNPDDADAGSGSGAGDPAGGVDGSGRARLAGGVGQWRLLQLRRVRIQGYSWWSPRLALYTAICSDRDLDLWLSSRGITRLLLTCPEDRLPLPVAGGAWQSALDTTERGLIPALTGRGRLRLSESTLVDLPRLRPALGSMLASGHRRWMAPHADGRPRWRYDIWQRDLARWAGVAVRISGDFRPQPWTGRTWLSETRAMLSGGATS